MLYLAVKIILGKMFLIVTKTEEIVRKKKKTFIIKIRYLNRAHFKQGSLDMGRK